LHTAVSGEPITGAEYIKEKHGPIPRTALPARRELEREGRLVMRQAPLKKKKGTFKKPVALAASDTSVFTREELTIVDAVIRRFWSMSTRKVRKLSHESAVFHSRDIGDPIPYETIFVHREQRLTPAEIKFGQDLAKRHGWTRSEQS
jgi:hypothetical protein